MIEAPGLKIVGILSKQDQCICKILRRTPHLFIVHSMLILMLNYKQNSSTSSLPSHSFTASESHNISGGRRLGVFQWNSDDFISQYLDRHELQYMQVENLEQAQGFCLCCIYFYC